MNTDKIGYKEMFGLFFAVNLLIISLVFFFSEQTQPQTPQIMGLNTSEQTMNLDKTIKFQSEQFNIKFKYPEALGQAYSEIITNKCPEEQLTEHITFNEFPNFIVSLNECDIGPNLFTAKDEIIISNSNKTMTLVGSFQPNYLYDGFTTLILKTEQTNDYPAIILKVLFKEEQHSKQEILNISSKIIFTIQAN
jgi:hypothetical protein